MRLRNLVELNRARWMRVLFVNGQCKFQPLIRAIAEAAAHCLCVATTALARSVLPRTAHGLPRRRRMRLKPEGNTCRSKRPTNTSPPMRATRLPPLSMAHTRGLTAPPSRLSSRSLPSVKAPAPPSQRGLAANSLRVL